jgi:hypothetical protein
MTMSAFSYKGREWSLEEVPEGTRFVIPAPRIWPLALFFSFWLAGWTAGEASAVKSVWGIISGADSWFALLPAGFLLFWLAGWTAGGVFAWSVFLFSLNGREIITLREGVLRIRPETFLGLGWTWKFPVAGMSPLKVVAASLPAAKPGAPATEGVPPARYGYIAIESGGKRWKLGVGLEESRAKDLLHSLTARFGLPRERHN